jgi:glucose-1-phosphate thymidylyltransferase
MVESGCKFRVQTVPTWLDCGRPETVLETNRYLLEHGHDNSAELRDKASAIIIPPVNVHPSADVRESVIGPYVTIAANCTISGCHVRNTIIDEGAIITDTLLEQSLIGRYARIEGRYRSLNAGDSSFIGFVG